MTHRKRQKATLVRRTVGYVRASTEDQTLSLDAQETKITAYSTALGFRLSEVVRDSGESAKTLKRPGIASILDAVRAGTVERVIVAKLDRLTRNVRDLAELVELCAKHDVALVSIGETLDTSSAAGRMVVNMLGVVAQWEREAIGERTATALAHKRRNGRVYGPTPFGYRRDGDELVTEPREQIALTEAHRLDREGASFREIGRFFDSQSVQPRRGYKWHPECVRAVLRSKIATETTGAHV